MLPQGPELATLTHPPANGGWIRSIFEVYQLPANHTE